jgi:hypothetical protein
MKPLTASALAASHRSPKKTAGQCGQRRSARRIACGAIRTRTDWGPGQGVMGPNAARKTVSIGVPAGFHPSFQPRDVLRLPASSRFGSISLSQSMFRITSQELAMTRSWAQGVAGSNPAAPTSLGPAAAKRRRVSQRECVESREGGSNPAAPISFSGAILSLSKGRPDHFMSFG